MENIKLTQYSHGAGCGCKISPKILDEILHSSFSMPDNDRLIVGNHSKDDAAVYDLKNGTALISTTDFFMPIVDDPFSFGRIASANAISDVYAMGGNDMVLGGSGVDYFDYLLSDGYSNSTSARAIIVIGNNSEPVAMSDSYYTA
ncbi:MAG: hypothetical protein RLZZ333_283, partial [Bacteroidota bacterium]